VIDRAGQLWLSKSGMYRYVIRSYEGTWVDKTLCTWHEYVSLADGSFSRACEKLDGGWETRRDWERIA